MKFVVTLAEEDHEKYGAGPYEIRPHELVAVDAGLLEELEDETGWLLLDGELLQKFASRSLKGLRAMIWLAYRHSGGKPIRWRDFYPQILKAEHDVVLEEGDPTPEDVAAQAGGDPNLPGPNRATRRAAKRADQPAKSARSSKSTTSG